ncbi:GNAT family N-acetyltransferase [Devosia rhodophyticola]|uniref:GNAT family N-acetyltransferase n=1 Tax=Devosia rhodophyticola TaxID=3026423 RepID=A0ABY7YUD5_9HYPH|nr:GNAT family N-acetyltransferase [Devosia rhodophyticola]WDR04817.1 GNAT family N-acetyltransferase [Devosia rhodophyticola]
MSQTYTIERQHQSDRGRYVIDLDEGFEAELTYAMTSPDVMLIDHTGVPPQFEGRGIAAQLVEAAIADARRQNFRIVPQCPYVAVQFKRHPEWADLRA